MSDQFVDPWKIDWVLLRQQKRWLVKQAEALSPWQWQARKAAEGLIGLLDYMMDQAVSHGGMSEYTVFGKGSKIPGGEPPLR